MFSAFSAIGQFVGGLFQIAAQRPTQPEVKRRGLYYPPEGGEVYASHQEWAGAQMPNSWGFGALALASINSSLHRCRIGKITLKQANG